MPDRATDDVDENVQRRHTELGMLLRARRAALQPQHVGLPEGKRRHVPGLRREEVAQLAELGLDWYAALEQGRLRKISLGSLRRVISILQLNSLESEHAILLARDQGPVQVVSERDYHALVSLVRSYGDGAAFAIDGSSNAFIWNAFADSLFGFSARGEDERRMLAMMIRDPQMRRVFVNWDQTLEQMIGVFRSSYAMSSAGVLDALVAELRAESTEFDRLWRAYTIDSPTTHVCKLRDADGRELQLHFVAFRPVDHPQFTVITLRPTGALNEEHAVPNTPSDGTL